MFLSSLNTNETMDGDPRAEEQMEVNLEVVVEMTSYDPFDTKVCQKKQMEGASTLTPPIYSREENLNVEITKDAL